MTPNQNPLFKGMTKAAVRSFFERVEEIMSKKDAELIAIRIKFLNNTAPVVFDLSPNDQVILTCTDFGIIRKFKYSLNIIDRLEIVG